MFVVLRPLVHETITRLSVRTDLLEWATQALRSRDQTPAAHHRLLLRGLQALSQGRIDRLLVHMPPGSAKSTYVSMIFPAWWFAQDPGSSIIAASHTEGLAIHFGRQMRDLISAQQPIHGFDLTKGAESSVRWRLTNGGEYLAIGTRGSVIGRRADFVIIDDPVGSLAQADRALDRDRIWNWFRSDLSTRLKPRGRMHIIRTRWHEVDLAGRLGQYSNDNWRIVKLAALADEHDELGRAQGDALWPEWEDTAALERKRASVGERTCYAAYQLSSHPLEGGAFSRLQVSPPFTVPSFRTD
jgi:hypothetical protein